MGTSEGQKKRPDGVVIMAIFWIITSFLAIRQGLDTLTIDLSYLPYLPELFDPSSLVWADLTIGTLEWISWGLPAGIVLSFFILLLGFLALLVVYGLFTGKSWSYKPAFAITAISAITYGVATALYASAPSELFYDPEFTLYFGLTLTSLVWLTVLWIYLRRPYVKQFIVRSFPSSFPLLKNHVGTRKGDVIKAIMSWGRPVTWREIQDATGLEEKSLNAVLRELFSSEEIRKVGSKYEVTQKFYADLEESFNMRKIELISWINQWKKVKKLDFSLEREHFFLEGRHLDDFSKELISHAKSEVLVVNPFIQDCDLSNTLRDAKKRGADVKVLTRPPQDKQPQHLRKKQEYHSKLKDDGISLIFRARVHAKLIVVDRTIAIVSSMNFYPDSSAGVSWEAGLISTDANIIESIVQSTLSRFT